MEKFNKIKGTLLFWFIVFLVSMLLSSCSSRKVIVDTFKKDSLSQISTKIATEEIIKTENNIITDEFTIEPLDTCKDIVINGIKYKNVILKHKTIKDNSIQNIKVSKKENKKQATKVGSKGKGKEIDKEENYFKYIIFVALIIVVWLNRKLI